MCIALGLGSVGLRCRGNLHLHGKGFIVSLVLDSPSNTHQIRSHKIPAIRKSYLRKAHFSLHTTIREFGELHFDFLRPFQSPLIPNDHLCHSALREKVGA